MPFAALFTLYNMRLAMPSYCLMLHTYTFFFCHAKRLIRLRYYYLASHFTLKRYAAALFARAAMPDASFTRYAMCRLICRAMPFIIMHAILRHAADMSVCCMIALLSHAAITSQIRHYAIKRRFIDARLRRYFDSH